MALTEKSIIDQITVDDRSNINVRRADQILRDGEVISQNYHRHVLTPGDDLTDQADNVKVIAAAAWAPAPTRCTASSRRAPARCRNGTSTST